MACLRPVDPRGRGETFMCRKCEDCRARWRREWTGRLMAEHASARATWFVTLTYAGGYENTDAYQLQREHVSEFYRVLRRQGFRFRPMAVGEYGGEKGRAHWHVVLFFENDPPSLPMRKRFDWTYTDKRGVVRPVWKYGLAQCELPRSVNATMAYVLKYLDKDPAERGEFSFARSPAVGERYLVDLARQRARDGTRLFPKGTPTYQVAGNVKDRGPTAGQLYDYWLDAQSALLPRMIEAYCREWRAVRPDQLMPWCKWVQWWAEGLSGEEREQLTGGDRVRLHFSVFDKMLCLAARCGQSVAVHTGPDADVAAVVCSTTGAAEIRWFDEGETVCRQSVGNGKDELSETLALLHQGRLQPPKILGGRPEYRRPSGYWKPRAIRPDPKRKPPALGRHWQKLNARGQRLPVRSDPP